MVLVRNTYQSLTDLTCSQTRAGKTYVFSARQHNYML